jgi:hypothetical protein
MRPYGDPLSRFNVVNERSSSNERSSMIRISSRLQKATTGIGKYDWQPGSRLDDAGD